MKEIYLQVNDDKFEIILSLLNNLKDGIVQKMSVKNKLQDTYTQQYMQSSQFQRDKQEIEKCLQDLENNKSNPLAQEKYDTQMGDFLEKLKVKYADS